MEEDPRNPRISLLKKYDIPIDHLSYEYVEKCNNKKELERIVRILRSGEEGSYPDLLKVTEERLRLFAPESRILRVETPILTKECLTQEEWSTVENDLLSWEQEMNLMDKSLNFEKNRMETIGNKNMPDVRKVVQTKPKTAKKETVAENRSVRIKSGDYAAWDKFDVDKELLKLDVEEERKLEESEKKSREAKKKQKEVKIENVDINKENYSSMEQLVLANQAKDRGNECYKSGDFESALKYYEISIRLCSTVNAYNNRAMTYLKLKQYENAIKDCNKVLQMEKKNIKALHRRATAYQSMPAAKESNNYDQLALQDLNNIIHLEPNNKVAQADLQKLKKKLNIEDSGKKFRMHITEESNKENSEQFGGIKSSISDKNTSIERLPLTYYGPSTSSFQCEPYSMMHRALSGSSIPGQVLCKCNSNRVRQNPLCQKCGEAMCTPKPIKSAKASGDANSMTKDNLEAKNSLLTKQTSELPKAQKNLDLSQDKHINIINNNFSKFNLGNEVTENEHQQKDSVGLTSNPESDIIISKHNMIPVKELDGNNSSVKQEVAKEQVHPVEVLIRDSAVSHSSKEINKISKEEFIENDAVKTVATERKLPPNELLKEVVSVDTKNNEVEINKNSSNQNDSFKNSKKTKHRKKKSKEHKESQAARKHLEPIKIEPVKVVHAAKYLHPTSVEPKVKSETPLEPQRETNLSNNAFRAFVPNKKVYSSDCNRLGPPTMAMQTVTTKKILKEEVNSYSSFEGNKENISDCRCNGNLENEKKENSGEEKDKETVNSAFEFMKTWEALKKFDESYAKRAEVIRKIRPSELSKVIGIKLDSDMLSCLLECLLRHFVETDPKRVIDLLKELPRIPRYGLVSMFLADADKKKMKKLIETAEGKGFMLDEDAKKNLILSS